MTDRPLRPLLPKSWRRDIQIVNTVLSADQENDADLLAVIGGSTVLTISDIPFYGPVGAIRIGYIDNKMVINPTMPQMAESQLDLVVVSTKEAIVMLETGAKEVSEEIVIEAIEFGHATNQEIIKLQEEMRQACGKPKVEAPPALAAKPEVLAAMLPIIGGKLTPILMEPDKTMRETAMNKLTQELVGTLSATIAKEDILLAMDIQIKKELRASILDRNQRPGGRALNEIRPIRCEVGLLPRTHGSALFTRGMTQVLTITTLGSKREEQQLDGLGIEETKRFMHHYNFPPFSTGEVGRVGSPGRREIGHGALAERALVPIIPDEEKFPYTIRLVSEVMSSNGSTSQASICASSMSLMDAGVPVKCPVAGVAMGLITDETGRFAILTDIEGVEDNYGDMDCKVAGTATGITAMQMDIKIKGVTMEMVKQAIHRAKDARFAIMNLMNQAISSSRPEVSPFAPRMYKIKINTEKIGAVIGTGGKTIRSIASQTDSTIDIEDDGTVIIGSPNEENAQKAIRIIEGLTKEAEVGQLYTGKVSRILNFGAMVEILPGKEGLVHVSELADYRVARVEDVVKVGDEVTVKVIGVDNMGRVNLSRKAVFADSSGSANTGTPPPQQEQRRPPPDRNRQPPPRR
jgi:polyribonucleotide nucleotidyltransferase